MSSLGGRTLCVFSAKGGVGRTTVAAWMALAFARHGQRVCLWEADFEWGGQLAEQFGTPAEPNLSDLVAARASLVPTLVERALWLVAPGVALLPAPRRRHTPGALDDRFLRRLHACLQAAFDLILVDLDPRLDLRNLTLMAQADGLIWVDEGVPEAQSRRRRALRQLDALGVGPGRRWVVLNRASPAAAWGGADARIPECEALRDPRTWPAPPPSVWGPIDALCARIVREAQQKPKPESARERAMQVWVDDVLARVEA
ncbi:MAG TPA: AAA family ATPase [Limnochordia bacterium]|nr:AAA family ATPase [Limnochordia bacterium]